MKARRVVIDTNVLISAAVSAATPPAQVTRLVLQRGRLLFSPQTFDELHSRLWRPKFDRYLSLEQRERLLHDLNAVADWVDIDPAEASDTARFSRDPDDDKFVHTALTGAAEMLISGDRDLLDLRTVRRVPMLSSAEALLRLQAWPLA